MGLRKIIKSTFGGSTNISESTNDIESNCKTIVFDNYGDEGAKIYVNDTEHGHTADYIRVAASSAVELTASGEESIIVDVFDVVFDGGGTPAMGIIKEKQELITQ